MHATRSTGTRRRPSAQLRAAMAAIVLVAALPGPAAAHAELVTSTPADGEILTSVPAEAVLTFSEALGPKSSAAVVDDGGTTIATGGPDPSAATVIRVALPALAPGSYEVQWTTVADDGHIERGTFSFRVAEPTAAPSTPAPATTDAPTVAPPVTEPAPSEAPSDAVIAPAPSAAGGSGSSGGVDVLLPILAVLVLVGGGLAVMLRRRGAA